MDIGMRLNDYEQSLSKVSFDSDYEHIAFIEDEDCKAYNFDSITKRVCKLLRGGIPVSSCDGFVKNDNHYYLIEFKNQKLKQIEKGDIQKKAYDSFSTIRMIINQEIKLDELSNQITLIIVFKDDDSLGYFDIKKELFKLASPGEERPVEFGLSAVKEKLYKEVHTIPRSVFLDRWKPVIWPE